MPDDARGPRPFLLERYFARFEFTTPHLLASSDCEALSLAELLWVNTFVSLFGGLIPVPGGIGIYEAGLTAGLTAMGIDPATATAAVLTDRMITAYIPPIFGYASISWMTKHDYL